MSEYSKGLVKNGFLNDAGKEKKSEMTDAQWKKFVESLDDKSAEAYANEEIEEEAITQSKNSPKFSAYFRTGFPKPTKRFVLVLESFNSSIEEMYFWILGHLRSDQSYFVFHKITDTFSASEQSAFWGAAQTRMKIQQENVSQYLVTIGKMVKDLFQIVRELRIIDERLEIYNNWDKMKSADITLKGLYIDMVEGASKNPASVYGLAQQVGFTILPDLFFNTHVYTLEDVDKVVDATKYNKAVKNTLKRKLFSYIAWKLKTDTELRSRRKFQLKYLRQHWVVIKMYMDWIKPYLRNIRRMQMSEKMVESVDIISAFETSMMEIEFMAIKPATKNTGESSMNGVIIATFRYRTRPEMTFQQDNYQHRGPIHVGEATMELRSYAMTNKEIEQYRKYKREESVKLFSVIDESVKAAMESLGDEFENYLKEAGESLEEKEDKKPEKPKKKWIGLGMLEPFIAVFQGFGEIFTSIVPVPDLSLKKKAPAGPSKSDRSAAAGAAKATMYQTYKNYKKAHKMITW